LERVGGEPGAFTVTERGQKEPADRKAEKRIPKRECVASVEEWRGILRKEKARWSWENSRKGGKDQKAWLQARKNEVWWCKRQ